MKSIVQIFQIDSKEKYIELAKIEQYEIKDFGNGFFISPDGLIASVAHVISNEGINSYALFNGKLQKVDIIKRQFTKKNQNHIDVAIGKIDIPQNLEYNEIIEFENVKANMKISLMGYSRTINSGNYQIENGNELNSKFVNLDSFCFKTKYYSSNLDISMHNFFTFILKNIVPKGLSGSPIINEHNNIVGIFKGGAKSGNSVICQALHIEVLCRIL